MCPSDLWVSKREVSVLSNPVGWCRILQPLSSAIRADTAQEEGCSRAAGRTRVLVPDRDVDEDGEELAHIACAGTGRASGPVIYTIAAHCSELLRKRKSSVHVTILLLQAPFERKLQCTMAWRPKKRTCSPKHTNDGDTGHGARVQDTVDPDC